MASITVPLESVDSPTGPITLTATYNDVNNNLLNVTLTKPADQQPTLFIRDPVTQAILFQETEPLGQTSIVHTINGYKVTFDWKGHLQVPYEIQFG